MGSARPKGTPPPAASAAGEAESKGQYSAGTSTQNTRVRFRRGGLLRVRMGAKLVDAALESAAKECVRHARLSR